jgi:hypothetical protein
MDHLPTEIFQLVLGSVGDIAMLKQCSLVQRSWRHESQQLLFSLGVVRIGTHIGRTPRNHLPHEVEDFVDLVTRVPHLSASIRAVRMNIASVHASVKTTRGDEAWSFPTLMEAVVRGGLTGLESLSFFTTWCEAVTHDMLFHIEPAAFPSLAVPDLVLSTHCGSLARLEFEGCVTFPDLPTLQNLLHSLPSLTDFSFSGLRTLQPPTDDSAPDLSMPGSPALWRLVYTEHSCYRDPQNARVVDRFFRWLMTTPSVHTLEYFTYSGVSRGSCAWDLLRSINRSHFFDYI